MSTELQNIFPDVDKTIQETAETFKERHDDIDELVKKVSSTEDSEITFEFEFFTGGTKAKFDSFVKKFGLTNENIDFVDFLQSDFCKEILLSNDLKIHIETGNIYYQDKDTKESIFEFMKKQQNISKGIIHHILKFDGNYKNYFKWILNEFEAQEKNRHDIFSNQNTKYLVYHYNDFHDSIGKVPIKIRHSLVTDNYLAAEEIQNQNWEYFIERIIEVCKFDGAGVRADEEFLLTTIENVTIAESVYTLIYNTVARIFSQLIQNLCYGEQKDIGDDFSSKNYLIDDSLTNLNAWISFYYLYGRFPGSEEFVNIPFVNKPVFLKTETNLSPANLYSKFSATDAKGLVSLHALAALNIYFGGNRTISQTAYGEFVNNLTYQALSQENDKIFMSFEECTKLAIQFLIV